MKNIKFFSLAALLMAGAAFTACSNDNDFADEKQQTVKEGKYTLTIQAGKNITRALAENNITGSIDATWSASDAVEVYLSGSGKWVGTLYAQNAGAVTTLSGFLEGVGASDELTLKFQTPDNYETQEGTLDWIADFCDYATATVVVDHISGTTLVPKSGETTFVNQQAIVKFVLKDKGNSDAAISPSALTVTDGTSTVSLTDIPAATYATNGASNVLYVAFPAAGTAKTVTLTATVGNDTYTYEKSGVTFTNGQYYEITVKMTKQDIH